MYNFDLWKHLVNNPRPAVLNPYTSSGSCGGLVKLQANGPHLRDSLGPEWGPKICISNKFAGDADAAGSRTTFEEPLS